MTLHSASGALLASVSQTGQRTRRHEGQPLMKLALLIIVAVLVAIALAGALTRVTFHVEVDIPAPPEAVWSVLTDTERYGDWNRPRSPSGDATWKARRLLRPSRHRRRSAQDRDDRAHRRRAPRLLRNGGGTPGVLTFDHSWILEPIEGGTRVTQHEVDGGIGMWFWDYSWIEPSYRSEQRMRCAFA